MSLPDLTLLRPLWLLCLPLVALAWVWLHRRVGGIGDWERASNPALLRALAALGRIEGRASQLGLRAALLAAGIAVVALSGPAVERRDTLSFRNLDGVVFVVDTSRSVTESDRWPQMLTMGRFGVSALGTRPGGLVVYGGDAYVATDMTADTRQLGQTFSLIDADTVPDPGSRPERGLALALRMLDEASVLAGDVILFTDGDGMGPESLTQAAAIADRGARLSVVSLADPAPEIATHAGLGGGRVFTLDQTDGMSAFLREDARTRLEQQDYPLLFRADYGRYLLILAALPLLVLFRRRAA